MSFICKYMAGPQILFCSMSLCYKWDAIGNITIVYYQLACENISFIIQSQNLSKMMSEDSLYSVYSEPSSP